MIDLSILKELSTRTPSKIVLLVFDGLGGLPHPETGLTELESAKKPNLDRLAEESVLGLMDPIGTGITPGSGPGHLSLFGYDPVSYMVGRGVIEALGLDFHLKPGDVAARCNFCTVDESGLITDRRAGRIPTEKNLELCHKLRQINIEGVELFILSGKEHRFAAVFRGEGLSGEVGDTDPQKTGVKPKEAFALTPDGSKTAMVLSRFVAQAKTVLADSHPANMILFRGVSQRPVLPQMAEVFKLAPAAIATYPMYRGLAKLVGMEVLATGTTFGDEIDTLTEHWAEHDFFFVHLKQTDSAGEDGDFARKVRAIEEADVLLPRLERLNPEVLIVTGDHSTPATLKAHSWHPVPILLASKNCRQDGSKEFSERACQVGGLGRIRGVEVLPLALAHALKLEKFGA